MGVLIELLFNIYTNTVCDVNTAAETLHDLYYPLLHQNFLELKAVSVLF